jgi:phospholipid-binding lipoprotein MlaA
VRQTALGALAAAALLAGCASSRGGEEPDIDPLQPVNRPIFGFNDALDRWLLNPAATGWDRITPRSVPVHLEQFFDNLRTPGWAVNDLLQGEVKQSGVEWSRFLLNSTAGLAGFFDPASHFFELGGRVEDFGQTLGVWGAPPGAYLMLPVLGPSGVRELIALPVDLALDPISWLPWGYRVGANTTYQINRRALRLDEIRSARESALDLYSSLRDGYRQLRENLIRNGEAPQETPDDLYELDEDLPE